MARERELIKMYAEVPNRRKRAASKKTTDNKNKKRSTDKAVNIRRPRNSNNNSTIKFYSTVDELNEDTLKRTNTSGTLVAKKVDLNIPIEASRRFNNEDNNNKSLHIDINQPKLLNHITDNKIDLIDHLEKSDVSHENINSIDNKTKSLRNAELSKIVVNELKTKEIIGDVNAPVTSNITFTSENDTLTAMAFIAGNLLNKLWYMEKDATGSSMETEELKQEKISDLLDLFKEPLNLRQEIFLKNALEQLSSAIDKNKDVKNVTICKIMEDTTKFINTYNSTENEQEHSVNVKNQNEEKQSQDATLKAISKLNNVLGLLKKFENVQYNLSNLEIKKELDLKPNGSLTQHLTRKQIIESVLTKDESNSLNMFGKLLEKVTNLLVPNKSKRNMHDVIKSKHSLNNNQDVRNKFMKMYNIDLANKSLTAKDKLVLDYISHINSSPGCALNKHNENKNSESLPSIEGNILLNLSEFFKMKSFADLINLIQPNKNENNADLQADKSTTDKPVSKNRSTTVSSTTVIVDNITKNIKDETKKFKSTKDKLKAHLKVILEDLIELQNAKGISPRRNIRIGDALPCIYNIMNAGKEIINRNNEDDDSPKKIIDMFNELKNDMKLEQTRRSGAIMLVRPKSAVVLERILKNLAQKSMKGTRRAAGFSIPASIDEVQKLIHKVKNITSSYKSNLLTIELPPADRLMLLKTLEREVRVYINALEGIKKLSNKNLNQLSAEQMSDFAEFVSISAQNISLNLKVVKNLEKPNSMTRKHFSDDQISNHMVSDSVFRRPTSEMIHASRDADNTKISRNQIIDHLIRNRVQSYIKLKEANPGTDVYSNIAKRVLFYLDSGNHNLAYELYKALMTTQIDKSIPASNDRLSDYYVPSSRVVRPAAQQDPVSRLKPLIQFEEPRNIGNQGKWLGQDHLIKQLLNIKNMGV